jgi:transglutaminase-like putative cysteine protease
MVRGMSAAPVRLHFAVELNYEVLAPGADFIFNIQAASTRHQRVLVERLSLNQPVRTEVFVDGQTQARHLRLKAGAGLLRVAHESTVEITQHHSDPQQLREVPVAELPPAVLAYLYPSRYCESDRLHYFAVQQFGHLAQGHARVQAIRDWVHQHVKFTSNSSSSTTSACDTLASGQGVCRDFAHLMIALCRAVNIPARFATGFDFGADPILGPPDFHAYVEVWLGRRWYLFDPSGTAIPMGFVRLATSRDAADAAFATIFGPVRSSSPIISITAVANERGQIVHPEHVTDALSTDGPA